MDLAYLNLLLYPIFILIILISILGYGTIINKLIFNNRIELHLKNLIFIQGLIFIGFLSILFNFVIPISNYFSFILIIAGLLFYFYNFLKKEKVKNEVIFIIFVLILSFVYSFYAGFNDDFNYHYETIKNYKNKNLFEILHHRRISYNSHWLFLNSIYSISFFSSTLFILSSLFFSISIYDFVNLLRITIKQHRYYLSIISFFCLIFFLGVLNQLKDLGTDIPGVIVCIYIIFLITNKIFEKSKEKTNDIFLITLLFCQFALIIKISNILIFLFLFLLIFKIKYKEINYLLFLFFCVIPIPWFFQNYIISGCLVWPITITCFSNEDLAIHEIYMIETFAKGDQSVSMELNNFNWIMLWLKNHSSKILETYLIYFILLFVPVVYLFIKNKNKIFIIKFVKDIFLSRNYKSFLVLILICNLIWFFFAPAYRFGVFYNLFLIIFLLLPFWFLMIKNSLQFILRYSKTILFLIFVYFIIENITRIDWYFKRYDVWPPIEKSIILERKKI